MAKTLDDMRREAAKIKAEKKKPAARASKVAAPQAEAAPVPTKTAFIAEDTQRIDSACRADLVGVVKVATYEEYLALPRFYRVEGEAKPRRYTYRVEIAGRPDIQNLWSYSPDPGQRVWLWGEWAKTFYDPHTRTVTACAAGQPASLEVFDS